MIIAKIRVNGVIAKIVYRKVIPAGIIGAQVELDYDEDIWHELHKTVVFKGAVTKDVITDANIVTIPHEVVEKPFFRLSIGVYGVDADGNIAIPTLWEDIGAILDAAAPSGDTNTDPSLPVWAQIQAMIGNLDELETTARNNLVAAVNEVAQSGGGGGSASIAMRVDSGYIQYSTDNGKTWVNLIAEADLKGDKGDTGAQGPQGDKGDTGAQGPQGETGPQGPAGADGADGSTPHIGDNGNWYLGATDTGKPSRGAAGSAGQAGKDGKSAYAYAVEGGYTGTEAEFATKLAEEIPAVDDTLTQSGKAADAKAVGDALAGKQNTISDLEAIRTGAAKGATALQSVPNTYRTAAAQDTIDSGKVDKVTGKGLSTNDYTAAAKAKVDAIPANPKYTDTVYDDTALKARVATIESKESAWDAKSDFSGSYNDLTDKPTIPAPVTEQTVSGWGFTKNTGTYSKPTGGIPKSDLASAVQSSLDKAEMVDTLVPDAATAQNQLADKLFVYAQAGQVTPLFANSTANCTDTTKVYVLPDGYIYGYINGAWTNTGHQFTNAEALEKVIDATCDIETISGGNYNLLKISEVSYSSRLQDNTAGIVSSTATNIVTGWIPVRQGKYYAVSALVDGVKDASAGAGRDFVQRINAKKADGTILVYNKYPSELRTELSRGKAYSVPTDATHMMFHIQIQDRTPQSLDISSSAKLKAFEPMIIEGDTAALAVSNSIDFAYVDEDADVPAIVNYTLKHDTTKEDKVSLSPYYRNVDYHMMPTSYYKGVGTDYDTTFSQNTSYATFITAWKTLITGHGGYVTETELGNASDNQKIYLYDFKPSRITNQRTNMPKIVIVAGQHGTEKSNVYGLYYFVNNLLNKWNESPVLEYLRNHVEIMIIPVLNTYGFDHFAYKNANGVNLNRNYDANWVLLADTTSDQYGGAAPFDQPETQIVRDLLLDNDDASLVVDFHTNGNGAVAQYSYINYYGVSPNSDAYFNRLIDAVAHQLASISSNFNLDYSLNQPDTVFGWLNNANGVGLLRDWATENNFAGVLVEGFNGFPNGTPFIGDVYKANEEIIANWLVTALNYLKG